MSDNRCAYSDLPAGQCAHCEGDDRSIQPGDSRRFETAAPAVRVWPPLSPVREVAGPPPAPEEPTTDSRVKVARALRAILDMADMLGERAVDLADTAEIPGGDAMVNLAHVANLEAWEHQQQASEALSRAYTSIVDEDPDEAWAPFQRLAYWSESWRRELDMDYGQRPSITSEARFLSNADVLAWAWDNERGWEEFVDDVTAARAGLENIVRDGVRETRSRIVCDRCTDGRRLIRKWAKGDRPDVWKCPGCKYEFTDDETKRAHAKQMRAEGAERWVELMEATGALQVQGWQRRVVRRWVEPLLRQDRCAVCDETWPAQEHPACPRQVLADGEWTDCGGDLLPVWKGDRDEVPAAYCDTTTRRVFVWWPDLWRKHLTRQAERDTRRGA